MQEIAGRMEYLGRFVPDGILRAQEAYICLNVGAGRVYRLRPITVLLITEMRKLLRDLRRVDASRPWLAHPFYHYPGTYGFTTDACAPSNDAPGGWGICVFGTCAYGVLNAFTVQAFDDKDISISPAELILAAAAVVVGLERKTLGDGSQVIWRTDSGSATMVHNARRAGSRAMLEAVRVAAHIQRQNGVKVFAQHLPGETNVIADSLSHATHDSTKLQFAIRECKRIFGHFTRVDINEVVDRHMEHLIDAIRNKPLPGTQMAGPHGGAYV